MPNILGRRALSCGRLTGLGATPHFHHRLLARLVELVLLEQVTKLVVAQAEGSRRAGAVSARVP